MKLLIHSSELKDLERAVKRLVCACIPCAVCKDAGSAHLSVWIQQDNDFPLALRVVMNGGTRPSLPHWARVFDSLPPATDRRERQDAALISLRGPTRTGTESATVPKPSMLPAPPARPLSRPFSELAL